MDTLYDFCCALLVFNNLRVINTGLRFKSIPRNHERHCLSGSGVLLFKGLMISSAVISEKQCIVDLEQSFCSIDQPPSVA